MTENKRADFGRDDLNALLGGGLPERLVRPSNVGAGHRMHGGSKNNSHKPQRDVADMTVEETAAMIMEQQKEKSQNVGSVSAVGRLRANTSKRRNYHALLEEQQADLLVNNREANKPQEEKEAVVKDDDFVAKHRPRIKAAPVVIVVPKRARPEVENNERSDSDSETSSSRDRARCRRRRRVDSSSSDSDDSAADQHRARLLQQRRQQQGPLLVAARVERSAAISGGGDGDSMNDIRKEEKDDLPVKNMRKESELISAQPQRTDKSSSDEKSTSEDESSEISSSEDDAVIVKPIFIPKHKRGTVKSVEAETEEENAVLWKLKEQEDRRKRESRAMVQQIVSTTGQRDAEDATGIEGVTGATNKIPDDTDEENDKMAFDRWKVRELERLLEDWDLERERVDEERERACRRKMTDIEHMKEDEDIGRRKAVGQRTDKSGQKFYHRGAFYMDESEWDQSDVRRKASEYAQAATGDDNRNRSKLPKVMQVKKFGFANQSKYKGLSAEDTTDKQMDLLPLHRNKRN